MLYSKNLDRMYLLTTHVHLPNSIGYSRCNRVPNEDGISRYIRIYDNVSTDAYKYLDCNRMVFQIRVPLINAYYRVTVTSILPFLK